MSASMTMIAVADFLAANGGEYMLPILVNRDTTTEVEIIEIRRSVNDDGMVVKTLRLDAEGVRKLTHCTYANEEVILRVACISLLTDQEPYRLNLSSDCYAAILHTFGLEKLRKLAHASPMSFDDIQFQDQDGTSGTYCSVFMAHYIGLYFVRAAHSELTQGILWCGTLGMPRIKEVITSMAHLAAHSQYLLFATSLGLHSVQDLRLSEMNHEVTTVEKRTGHHAHFLLDHPAAIGTLDELSARMSGTATAIAANKRLIQTLRRMLQSVRDTVPAKHDSQIVRASVLELATSVDFILRRIDVHLIFLDLLEARVRNQLTALFNLITKEEMKLSLLVAQDSKTIASATKRDSTSMKILAAVTVFFLPGTFVASLFSSAMFQWRFSEGAVISSSFWIYWATALPLTILTGIVCIALSRRWAELRQRQDRGAMESFLTSLITSNP